MTDRIYKDADGRPVSLETLCRLEPEWAASRIREMTNQLEESLTNNCPKIFVAAIADCDA